MRFKWTSPKAAIDFGFKGQPKKAGERGAWLYVYREFATLRCFGVTVLNVRVLVRIE